MNPLNEYPAVRKALYIIQWIVNLALGILAIVLTTQGESPQWFIITGAVFNFVWTYTGLTAQSNTNPSEALVAQWQAQFAADHDHGGDDTDEPFVDEYPTEDGVVSGNPTYSDPKWDDSLTRKAPIGEPYDERGRIHAGYVVAVALIAFVVFVLIRLVG